MNSILQITLGVVTAMGGFVDIGELVFSVQAGVKYGFALLWAILLGTIGIILFSEASGRVAAVVKKPIFQLLKERFPRPLGFVILVASTILNFLTCAAEVGGVAIALQLLIGLSNIPSAIATVGFLIAIVWILPFKFLEKIFGILGIFMIIFIAAVFARQVNFWQVASGFVPSLPSYNGSSIFTYLYFVIGIVSSTMMPYEIYFYSSGAIEEKWTPKDLTNNTLTSSIGMSLGAIVSMSLLILGAQILKPLMITPQLHGTASLLAAVPFGKAGLIIALLGIIFTLAATSIETALSGAYNISQYFDWEWGRHSLPTKTPKFSALWIAIYIIAFFVLLLKIDPVSLVEYAVVFSVIALPFTYYITLTVAGDKKTMGRYASKKWVSAAGWIYFALITIFAAAAIPLMILTNMGNG